MRWTAMRALAIVIAFACAAASASAADIELRAVRHGRDVVVSDGDRLVANLIALADSCSVNSTAWAVSGDPWTRIEASDSFVRVVFSKPRRIRLMNRTQQGREQQSIRALLLPLPEGRWP